MKFEFEECRRLVLAAVLAELEVGKSNFVPDPVAGQFGADSRPSISGIGLDIAPWHRRFYLALRDDDEKWDKSLRYEIGDWKLYPLNGLVNPPAIAASAAAIDYIGDAYESVAGDQLRNVAHMIFLSAAEALLDEAVHQRFQQYGIDAPYIVEDFPPHRCFEYVVTDEDGSIALNYCELVIANRITNRLRGQMSLP